MAIVEKLASSMRLRKPQAPVDSNENGDLAGNIAGDRRPSRRKLLSRQQEQQRQAPVQHEDARDPNGQAARPSLAKQAKDRSRAGLPQQLKTLGAALRPTPKSRRLDANTAELFAPGTYKFSTQAQLIEDLAMVAIHVASLLAGDQVPPIDHMPSRSSPEDAARRVLPSILDRVANKFDELGYAARSIRLNYAVYDPMINDSLRQPLRSPLKLNVKRLGHGAGQLEYASALRFCILWELAKLGKAPDAERASTDLARAGEVVEGLEELPVPVVEKAEQLQASSSRIVEGQRAGESSVLLLSPTNASPVPRQAEINASRLFEPHTYTFTSRPTLLVDLHLTALYIATLRGKDVVSSASDLSLSAINLAIDEAISRLGAIGQEGAAAQLSVRRGLVAKGELTVHSIRISPVPNTRRLETLESRKLYAQALSRWISIESVRLFGPYYARLDAVEANNLEEAKRQNQAAVDALIAAGEYAQNPYKAAKQEQDAWSGKAEASRSSAPSAKDRWAASWPENPEWDFSKGKGKGKNSEWHGDPVWDWDQGKGKARRPPPISDIDWAEIPEDQVRSVVEAYDAASPSPADSGIGFLDQEGDDLLKPLGMKRKSKGREVTEWGTSDIADAKPSSASLLAEATSSETATTTALAERFAILRGPAAPASVSQENSAEFDNTQQRHMKALQDAQAAQRLAEKLEWDATAERARIAAEAAQLAARLEWDAAIERTRVAAADAELAAEIAAAEFAAAAEAARIKAAESLVKSCVVCGDDKLPFLYPAATVSMSCTHEVTTCKECLQSWLTSELDSKGTDTIKCPECPSTLTPEDFLRCAPLNLAQKFDRLLTRSTLAALPGFSWCLAAGCDSGQVNIENASYMKCVACSHEVCLNCKVKWHTGKTCLEYGVMARGGEKRRKEEEKSEKMIQGMSKTCPGAGCGARIEKGGGCDHMTCRKCKWEFCWQCLASQKEIKRVGNTAHQKHCKFHSTNLDIAWPFNAH